MRTPTLDFFAHVHFHEEEKNILKYGETNREQNFKYGETNREH